MIRRLKPVLAYICPKTGKVFIDEKKQCKNCEHFKGAEWDREWTIICDFPKGES